mmetsp:Transcript_34247/g.54878  ORF Transcript_34247/g.54878 Transcript_34247/m.54878 type:complete len:312 (+) Transcript_34247:527-1462(+)
MVKTYIQTAGLASVLTPIHLDCVQVCLVARNYRLALEVCKNPILDAVSEMNGFELIQYFYYAARAFATLKHFEKAIESYFLCLSIPSNVVTKVHICAYQQVLLVSLIHRGEIPTLPKHANAALSMRQKSGESKHFGPYLQLADHFTKNDPLLQKFISTNEKRWVQDNNMGLVKQVEKASFQRKALRVERAFLTYRVSDLAKKLEISELELLHLLDEMVDEGLITASVDQTTQVVEFKGDDSTMHKNYSQQLDSQMKALEFYLDAIKTTESEITQSTGFLKKVARISSKQTTTSSMFAGSTENTMEWSGDQD